MDGIKGHLSNDQKDSLSSFSVITCQDGRANSTSLSSMSQVSGWFETFSARSLISGWFNPCTDTHLSNTSEWQGHDEKTFLQFDEHLLICTTSQHSPGHRHRASFPTSYSWPRWCLLDWGLFLPRTRACTASRCCPLCQIYWARWQRTSWWSPCTRPARGCSEGWRQVRSIQGILLVYDFELYFWTLELSTYLNI